MAAKGIKRGRKAKTSAPVLHELDIQALGHMIADPPASDMDLIVDKAEDGSGHQLWIQTPFGYRNVKKVFVEFGAELTLTDELPAAN